MLVKNLKIALLTIVGCFYSFFLWAQDKKTDVDINVNKGGGGAWYSSPIVWVIGGAVFILLLVALLRGGGNKD